MTIWSAEIKELDSLYTSIKGRFPELEKELEELIKFDNANVILIYSRRCLEVIITDLCECELKRPRKTEPLKGIIDKLSHEEKVPSHIIVSMQYLNSISTFGAHPKDFDQEQVRPVLINLATIIKWYVKYKDTQITGQAKPEEAKYESKEPINTREGIQKSKKRLILLFSGLLLIVAIIVVALFVFNIVGGKQTKGLDKSIAVLPFKSLSDDPEKQYLADGMMDAILLHLSKIEDLRVMSRTSVEQYRKTNKTTSVIGHELGVEYLLEGSFQKYDDDVRLIVQLIKTGKEGHEWANEYDRKWNDILLVQSEVAQVIAKELDAVITPEEKQQIEKTPTTHLAAYDAYLKGLYFYEKGFEDENEKAILWFKEAIRIDSTFALPWTYLSMCYWRNASTADTPEFKEAKRAAERALELDLSSGIAIVNMAEVLDNEYDFKGAEEKIKLALKIDPENQYVLRNVGRFYTKLGRREESISFCNLALQKDPNNLTALFYLATAYYYSENFTEAWATLKKYYELEYKGLEYLYYQILLEEGNFNRILNEPSFEENENARNVALASLNFASGHKNEAEKLCDTLKKDNIPAYWIAFAYAHGDEPLKVFEWLERSYTLKERELTYLGVEPAFKKFRNEPRVKKLLQEMKFPV